MESTNESHTGKTSRRRLMALGIAGILFLIAANIVYRLLVPPLKRDAKPSLPDLTLCTRLEIRFWKSSMDYLFTTDSEDIVSPAESQYLRSLTTIVIDDPQRVKAIAGELNAASHIAWPRNSGGRVKEFRLICYRDSNRLASLRVLGQTIVAEDGQRFRLKKSLPNTVALVQEIRPFLLRARCELSLAMTGGALSYGARKRGAYPPPSKWCSALTHVEGDSLERKKAIDYFLRCPAADKGKCHYAMNPHCKPDSPPDTVLLFEAEAGWNQHGGPELFTFDNHDPKGGCVWLNGDTVKFIRTEEELHALRWK